MDDLFAALVAKLEALGDVWAGVFASEPAYSVEGYRRLQRVVNTCGAEPTRWALTYIIDNRIMPERSAIGLVIGLAKGHGKGAKG